MNVCEWSYDASACRVDTYWDVIPSLFLILIQQIRNLFHWFIVTSVRATHDYHVLESASIHVGGDVT